MRAFANRGLPPTFYFYRDHHGHEVDFVVPVGERAHLIECKWSETPSLGRGPAAVARAFGDDAVLSRSIVTPTRTSTPISGGLELRNPVDFEWLVSEA